MALSSAASIQQLKLPLKRDLPSADAVLIVSDSNLDAFHTLAAWPTLPGDRLTLSGPAGCGKSRLGEMWAERVGATPLFGAEAAFTDPLELAGRPILLDDADQADEETLFHLINMAQSEGGALLLIARKPAAAWPVALPDLRSRLAATRAVTIAAPDDPVLAAMLRHSFAERSITPGDGVIDYLVRRIERSAEAAQAIVGRLDALNRPVSRALAREVIEAVD